MCPHSVFIPLLLDVVEEEDNNERGREVSGGRGRKKRRNTEKEGGIGRKRRREAERVVSASHIHKCFKKVHLKPSVQNRY